MGFSIYGYRSQSESAIDNEVPLYLSGANKQAVARVAPGASEQGLDVYADEVIQEHAGGKIARFGYGTAAAPTWVLDITNDGVDFGDLHLKGPLHDIVGYGAVRADGISGTSGLWEGTDCSAAIQAAHDAALAANGWVYLPAGVWMVDATIVWDPRVPLLGVSDDRSRLMPDTGTDGLPVLEVCGGVYGHLTWADFGIGDVAMPGRPSCAIVVAETAATVNSSSEHHLERLKVDGYYTKAALALLAFASSKIDDCIFHNNYDAPSIPAVLCNNLGTSGITSGATPPNAFRTGAAISDITWDDTEIHDASGQADQYALLLVGTVGDMLFDGCIIGGEGTALVGMQGGPVDLTFVAPTFYSVDVGAAAQFSLYATDTAAISNVVVVGGSSSVNGAVVGGIAGCTWNGLSVKSHRIIDAAGPGSPVVVALSGAGGTISDADLDCAGLAVNLGAASGVISGDLYRPGTVTTVSGGDNTRHYLAAGVLRVGIGAASTPTILHRAAEPTTGWYSSGASQIDASISGTQRLNISASGISVTGNGSFSGTVTATTAIAVGAAPAPSGGIRLSNNAGVYARSSGGTAVPLANLDGTDNLQIGDVTTVSVATFSGANGVRLRTVNGHYEFGSGALAVGASTGFVCIPSCPGTPTGGASPTSGLVPLIYDSTANRIWVRSGSTWRGTAALT